MPLVNEHCIETISKVLFINKQDMSNQTNHVRQDSVETNSSSPTKLGSSTFENREIHQKLNEFISQNGFKSYKTSAKTGLGIKEGFIHIASEEALNYDEDIE